MVRLPKACRRLATGRFSAASRAKMAAAQKARWAKYRASKGQTQTTKPVRIMSASASRKIAAAQKARWAKFRTGKKAAYTKRQLVEGRLPGLLFYLSQGCSIERQQPPDLLPLRLRILCYGNHALQ